MHEPQQTGAGTSGAREAAGPPDTLVEPAQREAAVGRLSAAFARDVLPLEEYERRVDAAYAASTSRALAELTADLPEAQKRTGVARPAATLPATVTAVLGSVERGGRVAVPSRLDVDALFGNVEMDLRAAEFGEGLTEIAVRSIFGNVEVRLPDDVTVESHGSAFLGSFAVRPARGEPPPGGRGARRVRITGTAVLGNVEFQGGGRDH